MSKYTIEIKNNETGEVDVIENDGHFLLTVSERHESGFRGGSFMNNINTEEIAMMVDEFEDEFPEYLLARVVLEKEKESAAMGPTPGCDCPVCIEKRRAASNPTS